MKSKKLFLLFLFCFSIGISYSQTRVTGNVVNTQGEPVVGATVSAKGAAASTMTDNKGDFSLNVPQGTKMLKYPVTKSSNPGVIILSLLSRDVFPVLM